jgi:hypothetical protein
MAQVVPVVTVVTVVTVVAVVAVVAVVTVVAVVAVVAAAAVVAAVVAPLLTLLQTATARRPARVASGWRALSSSSAPSRSLTALARNSGVAEPGSRSGLLTCEP